MMRPLELIHIDYLTTEAPKNSRSQKDVNILIVTDHFTRYVQAYVTLNQKATTVAKTLWDRFFVHYGFPKKIRVGISKVSYLRSCIYSLK